MNWVDRHRVVLIALVFLFGGGVLIAFWFSDEAPSALAVEWGSPHQRALGSDDGYFRLVGLAARENESAVDAGRSWFTHANALAAQHKERIDPHTVNGLKLFEPGTTWCDWPVATDCLTKALRDLTSLEIAVSQHKTLLQRFDELKAQASFTEAFATDDRFPIPAYQPLVSGARVSRTQAFLDFARGRRAEALERLLSDIELTRRLLATSYTLIQRMVAAAALKIAAGGLSEILRLDPALAIRHANQLAVAVSPLGLEEIDISRSVRAEYKIPMVAMREPCIPGGVMWGDDVKHGCWLMSTFFYRRQTTVNQLATQYATIEKSVTVGARQLWLATRDKPAAASLEKPPTPIRYTHPNAIGRHLLDIPVPDFSPYALRLHDTDVLLRAIGAQVSHYQGKREARKLPPITNPYTDEPIQPAGNAIETLCATATAKQLCRDNRIVIPL